MKPVLPHYPEGATHFLPSSGIPHAGGQYRYSIAFFKYHEGEWFVFKTDLDNEYKHWVSMQSPTCPYRAPDEAIAAVQPLFRGGAVKPPADSPTYWLVMSGVGVDGRYRTLYDAQQALKSLAAKNISVKYTIMQAVESLIIRGSEHTVYGAE